MKPLIAVIAYSLTAAMITTNGYAEKPVANVSIVTQSDTAAAVMAGKMLYQRRCLSCHSTESRRNGIGPSMFGIVGRKIASEKFRYSNALAKLRVEGLEWDETTLNNWLIKPEDMIPNTTMIFGGMSKADERARLIAYLKTLQVM